jgi:hypothetical protein
MQRTPIAALAFLIAVSPISVRAQDKLDGNVLKTVCSGSLDSAQGRFCEGYIAGYMAGFRNSLAAATAGARFCFPEHLTVGDWLAVVQKYLADSSHDLNRSAEIVVGMALYGAYGCKPSN